MPIHKGVQITILLFMLDNAIKTYFTQFTYQILTIFTRVPD